MEIGLQSHIVNMERGPTLQVRGLGAGAINKNITFFVKDHKASYPNQIQ